MDVGPAADPLVEDLVAAGRRAVAGGLVVGAGGNLSARLPAEDACLVTARGAWLDELDAASFSVVGLGDGAVRRGAAAPTTELALHLATYRARPDVAAVVHLHPQTSVLLAALGHPVRLLTTDHLHYVRRVEVRPFFPPGSAELAEDAAAAVRTGANCLVLTGHGCSVLGSSVRLAFQRAANLEEAARLTYRALLLGDASATGPVWDPDGPV